MSCPPFDPLDPQVHSSWLQVATTFAAEAGLPAHQLAPLAAFGLPGEPDPCGASTQLGFPCPAFAHLELATDHVLPALPDCILTALHDEVDRPQAEMFVRRFQAVEQTLAGLAAAKGEPEKTALARLLRLGLVQRVQEACWRPGPRALRVRAVVDFYYSQTALLHHRPHSRQEPQPTLGQALAGLDWQPVAPGLRWVRLAQPCRQGPVHLNLLRVNGLRLRALDCRALPQPTNPGGDPFPALVQAQGAMAGVSGGFFLYSEPDVLPPSRRGDPVGLLIQDGQVAHPPIFRRACLYQTAAGRVGLEPMGLLGTSLAWPQHAPLTILAVNPACHDALVPTAFNRAWGEVVPAGKGWRITVVGSQVLCVVQGPAPIPLNGLVLCLPPGQGPPPEPGHNVTWAPMHTAAGEVVQMAMAGGPLLLGAELGWTPGPDPETGSGMPFQLTEEDFTGSAPPLTFSQDETLDQNLLPRLAVGLTTEQNLIFLAADGRNFQRAPGLNLRTMAWVLAQLGCVRAMNLDGGSSKRMVVGGQAVDLSTTEVLVDNPGAAHGASPAPVRPVNTAILIGGSVRGA